MIAAPTDLPLLPQHESLIDESAISREVAEARGYVSVTKVVEARRRGFAEMQCRVPALLVPVHDVHGEVSSYQLRPDVPRIADGRALKYETPKGTRMLLDVPPGVRADLSDPRSPLWITEGSRKADAAVSAGLSCIALLGVWSWRGRNEHDGRVALPDWECIALNDREVYLAFDSDVMTKPQVYAALDRLKRFLESRGARVRVVYLPSDNLSDKVGLDDYLAAGHSVEELQSLATTELKPAIEDGVLRSGPYVVRDGCTYWIKETREGPQEVLLANFSAKLKAEVHRDDDQEVTKQFEIEVQLPAATTTVLASGTAFLSMKWPIEQLGAQAILSPGPLNADRMREAIQRFSEDVHRRVVYTHTGWREIDDAWVYLHAGGAIGPNGTVPGVEVDLPDMLARLQLPAPPHGEACHQAVRSSLNLLGLTGGGEEGDAVMAPSLGLTYRAVLGPCDVSLHLTGETGAFKSEVMARLAQHFGPGLDRLHLPSWASTANYLEAAGFAAKDAVLPIDDFVPQGGVHDRARLEREADRVFRGAGNRSGRGRLRPDGTPRPTRTQRATVFSTGEDVPQNRSLRARMAIVEVPRLRPEGQASPGAVRVDVLTRCQRLGEEGVYSEAMAAFVAWVAGHYEDVKAAVERAFRGYRDSARQAASHARDAEKKAHMAVGWAVFLTFASESGAVSEAEAGALFTRVWRALDQHAADQVAHQRASDPVDRFLQLLGSALQSGLAHVTDGATGAPEGDEHRWGWRWAGRRGDEDMEKAWRPQGPRIGSVVDGGLYVDPDAALRVAAAAGTSGECLPPRPTLGRRLRDRNILQSVDQQRRRTTVRKMLDGTRRDAWHLAAERVLPLADCPNRPKGPTDAPGADGECPEEPTERTGSANGYGPIDPHDARLADASVPPWNIWADWDGPQEALTRASTDTGSRAPPHAVVSEAEERLEDALRRDDEAAITLSRQSLALLLNDEAARGVELDIRQELARVGQEVGP